MGLQLAPGGRTAAGKREVDATRGDWASPAASRITIKSYVEDNYWPTAAHLEVSTRAAYRYYLDKHFLPRFGDLPMRRMGSRRARIVAPRRRGRHRRRPRNASATDRSPPRSSTPERSQTLANAPWQPSVGSALPNHPLSSNYGYARSLKRRGAACRACSGHSRGLSMLGLRAAREAGDSRPFTGVEQAVQCAPDRAVVIAMSTRCCVSASHPDGATSS